MTARTKMGIFSVADGTILRVHRGKWHTTERIDSCAHALELNPTAACISCFARVLSRSQPTGSTNYNNALNSTLPKQNVSCFSEEKVIRNERFKWNRTRSPCLYVVVVTGVDVLGNKKTSGNNSHRQSLFWAFLNFHKWCFRSYGNKKGELSVFLVRLLKKITSVFVKEIKVTWRLFSFF